MIPRTKKFANGAEVHPIGIGTWGIGGFMEADHSNDDRDIEAIRYSIQKGQNNIDTAEMYGNGHSEEIVGQAIKGFDRSKLFIASKVWKNYTSPSQVTKLVEEMLKRLAIDKLDMVYIHSPDNAGTIRDYIEGLNKAVDRGLTESLAISNFDLEETKEAERYAKHPIIANQILYNVLVRYDAPPELLEYSRKKKIMIVAYRPVERGLLADQCDNKTVLEISKKYKKTPAQIAINWLIAQENVVTIPKSTDPSHIDENLGAMEFEMEEKDLEKLYNQA